MASEISQIGLGIRPLELSDAKLLAPVLADYASEVRRGARREADVFYAESLLNGTGSHTVLGAFVGTELVGFALLNEFPDPIAGLNSAALHHLHVLEAYRGKGLDQALVDIVAEEATKRNWTELVIVARRGDDRLRTLAETMAAPVSDARYILAFDRD
jgi:GNAT superfamily N-acetyltransferase